MRAAYVTAGVAIFGMSCVATASQPSIQQLFTPNPAGCLAADAGALDLRVKVSPLDRTIGMPASGLVSGFRPGDVLTLVRTSKSGKIGLRQSVSLAASMPARTSVVFTLDDVVLSSTQAYEDETTFVVPSDGITWALFTSSEGEGEGEYMVRVRCAAPPTS